MPKGLVDGGGWVHLVIVRDWDTKAVVGHDAGLRCPAMPWLEALDLAVTRPFPHGARGHGVARMRATGGQPTSTAFMRACATLASHQACTGDHKPKGHADTERFLRTLKEEGLWLQEWPCPLERMPALKAWLTHANAHDRHSALGYPSPQPFERDDLNRHSPPFVAA
jgi:putative transposase